jgi:hypothetical protein
MAKLKKLLPHGVSSDNDIFVPLFLIRLPPFMREMVGTSDHKMAIAMVSASDTLWDARGGHNPAVAARPITAGVRLLLREKERLEG